MAARSATGFSDDETAAWFGFLSVHSLITRELDARLISAHGIALVEYEVLLKLSIAHGRLRMSELADVALLSRSGLTRVVDELESLGLVRRERDEHDGRVLLATITAEGRRRFAAARRTHRTNVRALFLDRLGRDGVRAMGDGWQSVLAGLGDGPPRRQRRSALGRRVRERDVAGATPGPA